MDVLFGSGSEWESLSESSEDQEELEFLYGGQAISLLSNLDETIGKIDDFLSFERALFHGDIVCLASEPSSQMGRIVNVDMLVDLEAPNGKVIGDVSSEQILKIQSLVVGDYVVHGHWLGRVDKVVDSVTVVFDDGTKSDNIIASDQEKLVPIPSNIVDDPQYPFYPGQRVLVKLVPTVVSRQARSWLCGSWKASHKQGTVCAVRAGMVDIHWIGSAVINGGGSSNFPSPPSKLQDAKDVTPLSSIILHSNWQLGDWCMLHPTINSEIFSHKACGDQVFVVAKTKTKVDVIWQDCTQSMGLDSKSLLPINIIDAHEFWPHQFVLEKEGDCCEDPPPQVPPLRRKWGVVQSVDAKEKTVNVKWWENVAFEQETVSAYELIEHPDYSLCVGDLVFRLLHDEFGSQTESGELQADLEGDNFYYLSCIGNVVGFKDGAVEVKWATGLTTMVAPHEIFRFDKYEGSAPSPSPPDFDENVEPIAEQMVDQDLECSNEKGKGMLHYCSTNQGRQKYPWKSISHSLPWSVIGFFTDFAVNLFRSSGSTSELGSNESCLVSGNENKSRDFQENGSAETCDQYSAITEMQPPLLESEELLQISEKVSLISSNAEEQEIDNDSELFSLNRNDGQHLKQFEMVPDCSDHFFLGRVGKEIASPQAKRSWLMKVEQEWCILDKNLPETIFVLACEERMDLLRAAIIGAPGTPYHDGIFFFDIFLPPDYPNEPPRVHYHSGGLRLNPNLYDSGKVCLSLLNTWTGADSEVWNPQSSTILQVLVSLQALVLNDKPYFNEAGYDTHLGKTEGEKNSVSYNENAFLLTCQSMIYLLRKPPKHFEEIVMEHFIARCPNILSACKEYMSGAPVGFASHENANRQHENDKGSSTGFKIMLSKLFDKLIEAFTHKGIDCGEFVKESP